MTDETPPAPTSAPAHRAPTRDPRPRSPLAVWALATGIACSLAALALGGLWILLLPAAVLAVVALFRIDPTAQRGRVMAGISLALSVLVGLAFFGIVAAGHSMAERIASGVLANLASDEPQSVRAWLTEDARKSGMLEKILARFEAVTAACGPYEREVDAGSLFLGSVPYGLPPSDVVAIGEDEGKPSAPGAGLFFVQARFRDATVHLEIRYEDDVERFADVSQNILNGKSAPVLLDLRFFRDK